MVPMGTFLNSGWIRSRQEEAFRLNALWVANYAEKSGDSGPYEILPRDVLDKTQEGPDRLRGITGAKPAKRGVASK